jgi:hypothetical protein
VGRVATPAKAGGAGWGLFLYLVTRHALAISAPHP